MSVNTFFEFLSPLSLIIIGILLKLSSNQEWRRHQKYWIFFVLIGIVLFAFKIYKNRL